MIFIKREIYLQRIRPFIGQKLIKILTGQRRVGKSFLLKQIQEEIKSKEKNANFIYLDLEKYIHQHIKTDSDLFEYIISKSEKDKKNYVFIDEIQEVRNFEKVLRNFYSEENYEIFCTGSNAKLLSGELATQLSGRQIEIKIHPLSYLEFLEFHNLEDSDAGLTKYMTYGGMPFLTNLKLEKALTSEYLQNLINTILFKDIVSRYNIRDTVFLQNLIKFIANNIGSLVSANGISKYLKSQNIKKTTQTVLDYLEYINNSFLINKVNRYDIIGKKIFESNEKYFFEDIGIRNVISGYNISDQNKIIENLVYNHLRICNFKVLVGNINKNEIDFVAEKDGEIIYIQVALTIDNEQTLKREFGNLLKINDNYTKYVITMNKFETPNTYNGIKHLTLREFLIIN